MSIFDEYDCAFFDCTIGDTATTIVSGSLYSFAGILKHENVAAFDNNKMGYLGTNTTMTVLTEVADKLAKGLSITINSTMWTLQEKRLQSNGNISLLVLSKV